MGARTTPYFCLGQYPSGCKGAVLKTVRGEILRRFKSSLLRQQHKHAVEFNLLPSGGGLFRNGFYMPMLGAPLLVGCPV